jgi:leader peptidase (prepilin peptidase)/N-methyltransferase
MLGELAYIGQDPVSFVFVAALLGLVVGSFLNVVIYRLPVMLNRSWQSQCAELTGGEAAADQDTFNLAVPGSTCPHCGHRIRAWENIPVISYLLQRGRCTACGEHISLRYPIIEAVTALLTAAVALHFGFGWQALAAMVLTWGLIALTMIDFDHQLLPDDITLPLLWLGLLLSLFGVFVDAPTALIGAMAGYLSLWSVYHVFRLLTGKEGMGYGDFKLLAVLGAWLGWQMLPLIILLSSLVGAVVGITLILVRGHDRNIPIPFGPYLAAAGWLTLLWGQELTALYLGWMA